MSSGKRKGGRRPRRLGTLFWGPSWLPRANLVGRVWGTVDGGAELQFLVPGSAKEAWLPYDGRPSFGADRMGGLHVWEITVAQLSEIDPLVKAICRRWALAHDDNLLHNPDDIGYRARYLTLVDSGGSVTDVRLVMGSVAQARSAAMPIYRRWAGMARMAAGDLELFADDVLKIRESNDSLAQGIVLPSVVSADQLMESADRLAKLWGWDDLDDVGARHRGTELPVGGPVKEGLPDPSPIGIGELLFFGRPITATGQPRGWARQLMFLQPPDQKGESRTTPSGAGRSRTQARQLMLPLSPVGEDEPVDHEWTRLFKGLLEGTVRAEIEDVLIESLVYHSRDYEPRGTRTAQAASRYLAVMTAGDRPWLRARRFKRLHIVSEDYALLEAYRDSSLRFARCLILTKDPA